MFVIMIGSAVALSSCGDDDDDNIGGSGSSSGSGEITVALATNNVQTIKLHKTGNWWTEEQLIFYKDYKYKYGLCLAGNFLAVVPYALNSTGNMEYENAISNGAIAGIVDMGKLNGCSEINSFFWKASEYEVYYLGSRGYRYIGYNGYSYEDGHTLDFLRSQSIGKIYGNFNHSKYTYFGITALPNHGYAIAFNTFEDGVKFMRVYEKGYTQQNDGEVTDITVEYQLFDPVVPEE